ncbi:transcription-repair coupling factor [candidate division BRC1 bacterium HGW-BRC1-1]|jgi:transcription-repair coupling factor (superfamily II helicase)|nr:MAG: transcription-repair coupling factor [candidate division BRC1 bacterium HGW-BRC1-1]
MFCGPFVNDYQRLLIEQLSGAPSVRRVVDFVAGSGDAGAKARRMSLKGLRASALGGLVAVLADAATAKKSASPGFQPSMILVVTANDEHSSEIYEDLNFFGLERTFHYPKYQVLPYDAEAPLLDEQVKHLELLHELATGHAGEAATQDGPAATGPVVCAASIEALFTRVAPLDVMRAMTLTVEWGTPLVIDDFAQSATQLGYERVPTVEARGEFSVRGGIIDVYPPDAENPIRIDLFGDEIESMRYFDTHTQRSVRGKGDVERVVLLPAAERLLIERAVTEAPDKPLPTLLDLLPAETLVLLDNTENFLMLDERFRQLTARQYTERLAQHNAGSVRVNPLSGDSDDAPPPAAPLDPAMLYATLADVEQAVGRFTQLHHSLLVETVVKGVPSVAFTTQSFEMVKPSLEHYITQLRNGAANGYVMSVVCDNDGQVQRMDEMLREHEIAVVRSVAEAEKSARGTVARDVILATGRLHSGFSFPEANLYIVTDREIFGRYKRRHVYRKVYKGTPIADAREIRKGDLVVHIHHGVGRYEGMRTQNLDGRVADLMEIVYADDDRLLVPTDKIAYVHKFSGADGVAPTLDRLGGKKWEARRRKSQEDIEKMAQELLRLYASRSVGVGYSSHEDTLWQREFESSFLFTETPDQLRAIDEVKNDMMADKPMDRLVCGDVGYGKTEVAIRAGFKTIQEGKQVALLAPTTILAQQHYNTFRERFADYPIRVEMVSRFQTAKQIREISADLKAGKIGLVVGTHALLSKSIEFKDLGLVVVDEEQRFGVRQKERLKELRASVDFLTLTATPIPRTLYMALSGLRDMSIINTPPADRHPIKTRIMHWEREQIEEAVLRELNRGGQVYFVHNRVHNIHDIARRLQEIVPSARIVVGHGQMPDADLEQVMLDFIDRKHDILVSTTIIESGLDIPNVNTIIINRADTFGLAQLYQIRGRVGRENRRAYAYLIVPQGEAITEHAVARLSAIEEFTELGMGFNIAMRDMEIRGVGNLLGKEQHGTMNNIGFELYCRLLEDAVQVLRGQARDTEEQPDVEIQWKVSVHIPGWYVPVESQRLMLYKRVAESTTPEELDEVAAEFRDRYGEVERTSTATKAGEAPSRREDLPAEVENLLRVARMRMLGRKLGLRRLTMTPKGFIVHRDDAVARLGRSASNFAREKGLRIYTDKTNALEFEFTDAEKRDVPADTLRILGGLQVSAEEAAA